MDERLVIVGAGISGLSTALALSQAGRRVLVLERDPPPLQGTPDEVFVSWDRRGVPQLRHSHGFVGLLRNLLRDRYPALYAELLAAGAREYGFMHALPPALKEGYRPSHEDERLMALLCRRSTLELVLHRHVAALPGVEIRSGVRVKELVLDRQGQLPRVQGVIVERGDATEVIPASTVLDATGAHSLLISQLLSLGAPIEEEKHDTGILYLTRFYRRDAGAAEPDGSLHTRIGDLRYLKFGIFPADHNTFSVTLVVPKWASHLHVLRDNEVFERVCRALPKVALWRAPGFATPEGDVRVMSGQHSHYRSFAPGGRPVVLGFLPVGDSVVRTNPLYGRGCSLCFLHAQRVAEIVATEQDAAARAVRCEEMTRREIRPFFRAAIRQDRLFEQLARHALTPGSSLGLRERLLLSFIEDGVMSASVEDLEVRRAFRTEFHMLAPPGTAMKRPGILMKVLSQWIRKARPGGSLQPASLGPGPEEIQSYF